MPPKEKPIRKCRYNPFATGPRAAGAALAITDRIMEISLGRDVNDSMAKRYFPSMIMTPHLGLRQCIISAHIHLDKLKRASTREERYDLDNGDTGVYIWLVKAWKRVESRLNDLPVVFSPPESIEFANGYNEAREWGWLDKASRHAWELEHGLRNENEPDPEEGSPEEQEARP